MSTQSATSEIESESERGTAIATATATSTELRLGPPGSESQDPLKSSAKRGFSDVNSHSWVKAGSHHLGKQVGCGGVGPQIILNGPGSGGVDVPTGYSMAMENKDRNHNSSAAIRASKEEVVGWPPIRSFRKNSMATNPWKSNDKADNKLEGECVYVKVSMDGAPYLRKVDLNTYGSYAELSSALEKMFSCFTIGMTLLGQYGYKGAPGRDGLRLSGSRLKDVPHSSEHCVLTYEDKDGDWMLVGDVPWDMFTNTCTRIRITKSSEAIGLAPRAMEKYKNKN